MRTRKILFVVMMFLILVLFYTLLNQIVTVAYEASKVITPTSNLEVVNNYGEQTTWNPQIVGENR